MDYKDASVPISKVVRAAFSDECQTFGHFAEDANAPYILIKNAGKSTIQITVRHKTKIAAMDLCTRVGNYLKASFAIVPDVNVFDIDFQTDPTPSEGHGGSPEAWAYMDITYFEN